MSFLNDPARLIDCPNCDGTFMPEDPKCEFCGYKNPKYWDFEGTQQKINDMKRYEDFKE